MIPLVRKRKSPIYRLTRIITKISLSIFFQIKTDGVRYLPISSAFILLAKHQRWEDIPLLGLATPRPLYFIAKYELFLNPVSGCLLSALGGVPLNRDRPLESRRSLKDMIEHLKKGEGIVIFPEGTYYKNKMGPGHVGLIRMVLSRFTVPFIPVGIKYSGYGGRTMVRVNFGRPVYEDSSRRAVQLLNQIMKEIARLSGL